MNKKKLLFCIIGLMGIIAAVICWQKLTTSVYKTFSSPDNQYEIIVYRKASLFGSIGGSGDSPGVVYLVNKKGKVLQKKKVDMVQEIDVVRWNNEKVDIKLFAEWELK